MPSNSSTEFIRQKWLENAHAKGLTTSKQTDSVYKIADLSTNIRISSSIRNSRCFFDTNSRYLDDDYENPTMYVFCCGSHELFYAIPFNKMQELALISTKSKNTSVPKFNINVYCNLFYPGNQDAISISSYLNDWSVFNEWQEC